MTVELNHLFVCTAAGAPEAEALKAFGLTEGTPNTHPGQGTSNRRFFFRNAMLKLLWVHRRRAGPKPDHCSYAAVGKVALPFDHGAQGRTADFRPVLSPRFRW